MLRCYINEKMIHKSLYLSSVVKNSELKFRLKFLLFEPLYKHYKITVHWDSYHANTITSCVAANSICDYPIEHQQRERSTPESDVLLSRQKLAIRETWMVDSMTVNVPGLI
ncbi:helitron_like_N domain-containing protein [Trichonephila clavata]|uniref:Helitron_like_N domain-containing protein n=1 Tax=Trichonephila clavata TaxID=2740835 RepID=A0A8X6GJS7_TRICU|nr:helitron_like_N domain-containing protein [Trichonephila clavata]